MKLIYYIRRIILTNIIRLQVKECGSDLHVNHWCSIPRHAVLGNNVNFNGMKIRGRGKVRIGNNFHSGTECLMITQNHNYDNGNAIPYDNTYMAKDIIIDDNVWIGDRVIILGGVTIGEGAVIQAGSVVVNDIPPLAVAGGAPARVFKMRDAGHYYELKEKGSFY